MKKFFIIGKIKCCFCNKAQGLFHSVHAHGIYSDDVSKRTFFHMECLRFIQEDPLIHSHEHVDLAIWIEDSMKSNKEFNKGIVTKRQENLEKLRKCHIESMLPNHGSE